MLDRAKYTVRNPDHVIEELILAGMIFSTEFLDRVMPRISLDYFNSKEIQTVIEWIADYYENHSEAPGTKILTVGRIESRLDETIEKEKIESLLKIIVEQHGDSFNVDYALNKAFEFFKRRSLTIAMENTSHLLSKGELEDAELAYYKYREVAQGIQRYPKPFSEEALRSWWDSSSEELLRFPGYLGEYLSPICRSQLVGVMGPPKRGKTTVLVEFACMALMHKLKVAFFSLEMSQDKINQRIDTRLAGWPRIDETYKDFKIPVMDCYKNQSGECKLPYRKNTIALIEDGNIVPYSTAYDGKYVPCCHCLEHKRDNYAFAVWYQTKRYTKKTKLDFSRMFVEFQETFGRDKLVVESYPVGRFSCKDLRNRLTLLEQEQSFTADVVCIDYADIMQKRTDRDRRLEIGDIWEQLTALSKERNCLVVTASQTNRSATSKPDLTMEDLAEDYSKAMIADMFLAINQTVQEKDKQVLRLAIALHRHRGFSLHHQCRIIQAPDIGQFCLGSCPAQRKLKRN